jgi:hypothetical protein
VGGELWFPATNPSKIRCIAYIKNVQLLNLISFLPPKKKQLFASAPAWIDFMKFENLFFGEIGLIKTG